MEITSLSIIPALLKTLLLGRPDHRVLLVHLVLEALQVRTALLLVRLDLLVHRVILVPLVLAVLKATQALKGLLDLVDLLVRRVFLAL
jgi:hypothetical protein